MHSYQEAAAGHTLWVSSWSHAASKHTPPYVSSSLQGSLWLLNRLNLTISDLSWCKGSEQDMKLQVKTCCSNFVVLAQNVAGTGTGIITAGHDTQDYAQKRHIIGPGSRHLT